MSASRRHIDFPTAYPPLRFASTVRSRLFGAGLLLAGPEPLPSSELEKDAEQRGIKSDEAVEGGGDTHLTASESGHIAEGGDRDASPPAPTEIPPPD